MTPDAALAADIDATCRLTGEFTLRSGQVADTYFDKYLFEAQPALLDRVAAQMVDLLPEGTELLGGLELGGIPIATMVARRPGCRRCSCARRPRSTAPPSSPRGRTSPVGGSRSSRT